MPDLPFTIVDVFAERKYAGNPLAVVRRAKALHEGEMQAIARETNFSETTFVQADEPRDGAWDVRIFTPQAEIPFAGHPTLGTAFVLLDEVLRRRVEHVDLHLKVGRIRVTPAWEGPRLGLLWMRQRPPVFGARLPAAGVAEVLGLAAKDLDARWPIEEVSTGLPHLLVPVKDLETLRRVRLDRARYDKLVAGLGAKTVCAFAPGARDASNHLTLRVFAPFYGIAEDPATGSANGSLAAYLAEHRVFGETVDVRVEQGHEIGRPSLLHLRAQREKDGAIGVDVGGRVVKVVEGKLA